MAIIALEGMHFYAYHGFYEEERIIGSQFVVDVYIHTSIGAAAAADDLYSTVNYETAYFIVQSEMRKPSKLLETLAQSIADRLQGQFERTQKVTVRVRKRNPPLGGRVESAFVEYTTPAFGRGGMKGMEDEEGEDFGGMFGI